MIVKNEIWNKFIWALVLLPMPLLLSGQFPPAAGMDGSTAISAESDVFVNWASSCTVERGWKNIVQVDSGRVSYGNSNDAIGVSDNEAVSLGDGGIAVLEFDFPIVNGDGADFAVFENSFDGLFLELAFVEVSSDGIHFFRFPATSYTDTTTQVGAFGLLDPTRINNLAGKYEVGYGTPFDLEELNNIVGLNIGAITHVKLIDVVGSIDEAIANRDASGSIINDPFPTPFDSGGFDLDAVGVIHESFDIERIVAMPNPVIDGIFSVLGIHKTTAVRCYNAIGQEMAIVRHRNQFHIPSATTGIYFLVLDLSGSIVTIKILIETS